MDPFLTPPEVFVKDYFNSYQPPCFMRPGDRRVFDPLAGWRCVVWVRV